MIDIAMDAYINKLTVLELVTRLENWATTNLIGGRSQVYPERDELVAALRKAVIREASAGLCYAIEDKKDTGGKTTKLRTTYRVLPGCYEMVPVNVP